MSFQFQHKEYSWLFAGMIILVLLFLGYLQWKKKVSLRIGDENLVKALVSNYSSHLFFIKFFVICLSFACGIIAVMNPGKPDESDVVTRKGIDIAIALDVSNSMLAADLSPNRLERAKQFIIKLINQMPNDRIALVLFAGKAYLQMPLTTDHGAARLYVSSANPDVVPQQGTIISDALNSSVNVFEPRDNKFKTVVLISDGEDHDDEAINTAKKLSQQGVMINTVGIGSPEGATITDPATGGVKKDEAGNTIISTLNEKVLQQIAAGTNGVYIRLQNSDDAVSILAKQLSQIDKKTISDISQLNFKTFFTWFAAAMFLLLLLENFIPERKKMEIA